MQGQSQQKKQKRLSQTFKLGFKNTQHNRKNKKSSRNDINKKKVDSHSKRQKSIVSFRANSPSLIKIRAYQGLIKGKKIRQSSKIEGNNGRASDRVSVANSLQRKNYKKIQPSNSDYDIDDLQRHKFKSHINWVQKNKKLSLFDNLAHNQYGCSNFSSANTQIKKSLSNLSLKAYKKNTQRQQIERLLRKYATHLNLPKLQQDHVSKKEQFRTLSTDDKSQNKKYFIKKRKNFQKEINLKKITQPSQLKSKNKNATIKSNNKKNSSKKSLPEYFGCLSINKVESKIQTMKQKSSQKSSGKSFKQKNSNITGDLKKKSSENLVLTKIKQENYGSRQNNEFQNNETKRGNFGKQLQTQRVPLNSNKRKIDQKIKTKINIKPKKILKNK